MKENPIWSRRAAVGALIGAASGVWLSGPAPAADKMTRAQAEYQDTPNGIYSCGSCTLFEEPNACKVVEGEVSRDGWCKAFEVRD